MNYEELLETRDARKTVKIRLPFGFFYKRLIDGKYSNFVEFHDELTDSVLFNECVRQEQAADTAIGDRHQLHFTLGEGEDEVYALAVESGNYQTLEQVLNETPAMVARKDFLQTAVHDLVSLTELLNAKGIQHVCFAPSNVLMRKSDGSVRLLLHGSFYHRLGMNSELYEGLEDYVAPEVLRQEAPTDRSDVYSLARLIEYLYASSGLPVAYKAVIQKATAEDPEARYESVHDMYHAMNQRRNTLRTAMTAVGALAAALIVVALFFELLPNTEPVEFVKPVEDPITEEILDDGFDPATELGPDADSASIANAIKDFQISDSDRVDERKLREFEAKGEQIFRKLYTKEAERILSKIYNNEKMNNNQKNFEAASDKVMQELVAKQRELADMSSLSEERTQRIASEIIEQITERKKSEMGDQTNKNGIQK